MSAQQLRGISIGSTLSPSELSAPLAVFSDVMRSATSTRRAEEYVLIASIALTATKDALGTKHSSKELIHWDKINQTL